MKKPLQDVKMPGVRDARGFEYALIDLDQLTPDPENPRIPSQESALETMLALVEDDADGLFNLAKDIVKTKGTNPAELLNVRAQDGWFIVKEGNRRITAQKLLRNPEQLRGHVSDGEFKRWLRLAKEEGASKLPATALAVIGDDHEEWIDRRHLGAQGGVGVIDWDTEGQGPAGIETAWNC